MSWSCLLLSGSAARLGNKLITQTECGESGADYGREWRVCLWQSEHTTFGNRFNSQTQCIICVTVRRRKARPAPAYQEKSESLVCEAFRLLLVGNWLSHTSSSMIVLGKQVGEVWKIPRIPPRASPSEEYSEFPDFSSLFTQDYYRCHLQNIAPPYFSWLK